MSVLLPRLVHAWKMIPKAKESLAESPAATARRFYYDELVFDPAAVKFVIDSFGATQICIGTDYPFALATSTPSKRWKGAASTRQLAAISSTNAKRFLGLS